jgi:hypothetical protein
MGTAYYYNGETITAISGTKSELEQLKEQRKAIDRRIKELTCPKIEVDGACLKRKTYRGKPVDSWVVTVEEIGGTGFSKEIVLQRTREDALDALNMIILTLTKLKDVVAKESD